MPDGNITDFTPDRASADSQIRLQAIEDHLLDNAIINIFEKREAITPSGTGSFSPVILQTGAGKTYNAIRWLVLRACRQHFAPEKDLRKSVYMTPNRHNIESEYRGFRAAIEALGASGHLMQAEIREILSRTLMIRSNVDGLGTFIDNCNGFDDFQQALLRSFGQFSEESPLMMRGAFFEANAAMRAKRIADSMSFPNDYKAKIDEDVSRKVSSLRNYLRKEISRTYRDIETLEEDSHAINWMRQYMPDVLFAEGGFTTAFMTVSKAMTSLPTLSQGPIEVFSHHPCCIVIDEIDASKGYMQNALFTQDSDGIDLAELVCFFANTSTRQRKNPYPENEKIEAALRDLFNCCDQMVLDLKLDGTIMPNDLLHADMKRGNLLFAGDRQTFYSSADSLSVGYTIEEDGVLLHHHSDDEAELFGNTLESLLFEIENKVDFTIVKSLNIVSREIEKERRLLDPDATLDPRSVLLDYLHRLRKSPTIAGTTDYQVVNFLRSRMSRQRLQKKFDEIIPTPYDTGVKVDKVAPPRESQESEHWQILVASADKTAEKVVEEAAEGNVVIGISATAGARTVVRNFDMTHLHARLGDRFVPMFPEEISGAAEIYRRERRYAEHIEAGQLRVDAFMPPVTSVVTDIVRNRIFETQPQKRNWLQLLEDTPYEQKRLERFASAVDAFLCDDRYAHGGIVSPGMVMLAFLSRNVNAKGKRVSVDDFDLKFVMNRIIELCGARYGKTPQIVDGYAADLREGVVEREIERATQRSPVIVLTTHDSMASGFNPQRKRSREDANAVCIGTDRGEDKIDIDAVYIEKPTRVIGKSLSSMGDKLTAMQAVTSLHFTGAISRTEAEKMRKTILCSVKEDHNAANELSRAYLRSEDSRNAIRALVEQILGRISRTPWRRPVIRIMVDDGLQDILRTDVFEGCSPELKSYEYLHLCQELGNCENGHINPDLDQIRRKNENERRMFSCVKKINQLLKKLRTSPQAQRDWQRLREILMEHPIAEPSTRYPSLYVELPVEETGYSVWSNGDATNERTKFSFDRQFTGPTAQRFDISAAGTRLDVLMENRVIRHWFEERGYATSFEPSKMIMTPMMAQAIYMGAIGEEGLKALISDAGSEVHDLDPEFAELFDFCAGESLMPVDAKHYRAGTSVLVDIRELVEASARKLEYMGRDRCLIVQVIGTQETAQRDVIWHENNGRFVGVLSGLIDQNGVLIPSNMRALMRALES